MATLEYCFIIFTCGLAWVLISSICFTLYIIISLERQLYLIGDRESRSMWDGRLPSQGQMSVSHAPDYGSVCQRHRNAGLLHLVEV